jgi:hypothetical protein
MSVQMGSARQIRLKQYLGKVTCSIGPTHPTKRELFFSTAVNGDGVSVRISKRKLPAKRAILNWHDNFYAIIGKVPVEGIGIIGFKP